jgi:hypothetical protein
MIFKIQSSLQFSQYSYFGDKFMNLQEVIKIIKFKELIYSI